MKKLLVQSDDFGFTFGTTDGAIHAIKNGIIGNTGLFTNMPSSAYAAERVKDLDVCLGIDINLVAGKPVTDPSLIPHLVDENGNFKSSRRVLKENPVYKTDRYLYIFENDPFDYDEVLLETENQVKRFIELVGRKPEYINGHSVITPNTENAAKEIALKYGIENRSSALYFDDKYIDLAYFGDYEPSSFEEQLNMNYKDYILNKVLPNLSEEKISFFVGHCGYLDKDLLSLTSLTVQRINDVSMATDPEIIKYIKDNDIELITYRDIDNCF